MTVTEVENNAHPCRLLLEKGADVTAVDFNRRTAFFFACARGMWKL